MLFNRARASRGALSLASAPLKLWVCWKGEKLSTHVYQGLWLTVPGHGACPGRILLFSRAQPSHLTLHFSHCPLELWRKWRDTQRLAQVDCGLEDVVWGQQAKQGVFFGSDRAGPSRRVPASGSCFQSVPAWLARCAASVTLGICSRVIGPS